MKLPEPISKTFSSLISEIETGQIKIPQFQRDFVWTVQKSAGLMDSIIKGYPIGTFIFWRTKERLRAVRNIGNQKLPHPEAGEYVDYVLDGQQRLTSLFASLKGLNLTRESKHEDNFSNIYIDLSSTEDEQIVVLEVSNRDEKNIIRVIDLINGDLTLLASYPKEYHKKIQEYKNRIESYQYSIIQIKDAPIDIATEIFTRINVGGKKLSLFEIMVAKTYDHELNFDLSEKYKELMETLEAVDYNTISDATVLQLIAMLLSKECKRQEILKLNKADFIEIWDDAVDAIERCVDYFRSFYRIPVSMLLPYNALVVPFSYFFYHHNDKPTGNKQKYLQDFFWRCALSGRYSSSVESKLAQDIKRIDLILKDELPKYDWSVNTSKDFIIDNGWFSAGRSYIKAILCIFSYQEPKSFIDNSIVNINNAWLKRANSKNYHHFFPKAYLNKKNEDNFYINHIVNITIVDDFLNKRKIRAKAPSKYMSEFIEINDEISKAMETHLIFNIDKFGIAEDNYDTFFNKRAKAISKEIGKRIIKQKTDKYSQPDLNNDYEEEATVSE